MTEAFLQQGGLAAAAIVAVLVPERSSRRRALSGVLLLALALASRLRLLDGGVSEQDAAARITLGIGALGLVILAMAVVVSIARRRAAPWVPGSEDDSAIEPRGRVAVADRTSWDRRSSWLLALHLAGVLLTIVALHLHGLMGAALVAAVAGVLLDGRLERKGGAPVVLVGSSLMLLVCWVALTRVAGPMPLGLGALRDAPYSPAFEILVALPVAVVVHAWLGLWPFHATSRGPLTALVGAGLVVNLLAPVLPHGLVHWQPVLYPAVVVAIWHGAVTRRDVEVLAGLGALGLLSAGAVAGWAGMAVIGVAVVLDIGGRLSWQGHQLNRRGRLVLAGALVVGAAMLGPALSGGLGAEAFYTVLGVAGGVVALWRARSLTPS